MAGCSGLSIQDDLHNYDFSSSESEPETPPPKRPADEEAMEARESEAASTSQVLQLQVPSTKKSSKKRGPEPTEGYIYGFILPFSVDNDDYCVVKVGKTGLGQVKRRLKDHNSEFAKATSVPIFTNVSMSCILAAATSEEDIVKLVKDNKEEKIFLLSKVKEGLTAAEFGARACIGVAPFNTGPIFKTVFPDSKRVTITEWVVARRKVVEDIQADFWCNEHVFDTADALLEKLRELNKRKHIPLTISLTTLDSEIYRNIVKVPQYASDSRH